MRAVIDIGSNSFHLIVARLEHGIHAMRDLQSAQLGKATVASPTLKRLLFHMFCVLNL